VRTGDITSYYRLIGAEGRPVLMLSHSLGQDHGMWDAQAEALAPYFRVLCYDIRGHGASTVLTGEYSIADLGRDALALAGALGIDRFAFCGLSLGAMVGLWLAANARGRLSAVVLANTSAHPGAERMEARRNAVLTGGMTAVADEVMGRFFSPRSLSDGGPTVATARRVLLATDPVGYAGCCAAIRDFDITPRLNALSLPTLVISGDRDVSLPWSGHGEALAREIPGARSTHLPAAHLSNLEAPRAFTAALADFLIAPDADVTAAGMKVRRDVLGDAHVDRAIASTTSFTRDFQHLITRYAWGTIWTRPGLDVRTRRLLVLATTAALGRWEEFRLHVRAGLARDLELCDLQEVLLQIAIYAGVPAANAAFHAALEEHEKASRGSADPA
jgi:3-oxoadipate enol-lactonase/4-carboxymuconolactone decarboxylase